MSHPSEKETKKILGISIGDLNGIGPEIILKTFADNRMLQVCTPVLYASSKLISFYRKLLNIQELNLNVIRNISELSPRKFNVLQSWEEEVVMEPGVATSVSGSYALRSLKGTVEDLKRNKIDGLVTAPIDKQNIQSDQFDFPGHTEFLAKEFNSDDYLMFMVSENLKVSVVSGHVALQNAPSDITFEKILSKLKVMHQSLIKDFQIRKPRIAVLGLNPHAGDKGLLGKEEESFIMPAIKKAFENGIMAYGPYPADGFFGSSAISSFDAVLAMYHDQGLVPFKTLSFGQGVNYTAGLPIVRTSPDHGTAYDIAGKNKASENSFRQAVYTAVDIIENRDVHSEISEKPLKFSKLKGDR
ncbi:MAG: 4-hydroxythreonine-4-phosphate dehydrogenase PdxA [Bacteroidia bacterium]